MSKSPGVVTQVAEEPEEVIEIADIFSLDDATAEKKPAPEATSESALKESQVNKLLNSK